MAVSFPMGPSADVGTSWVRAINKGSSTVIKVQYLTSWSWSWKLYSDFPLGDYLLCF